MIPTASQGSITDVAGIKAGHYDGNVALNDLAPTLATILGVETPAGSQGRVLTEMLAPAPAEHVSSTR